MSKEIDPKKWKWIKIIVISAGIISLLWMICDGMKGWNSAEEVHSHSAIVQPYEMV